MLVSVATLLARAKRQRQVVPFVAMRTLDAAQACLEVATVHQAPLVLCVEHMPNVPARSTLNSVHVALWLAERATIPVGVMLDMHSTELPDEALKQHLPGIAVVLQVTAAGSVPKLPAGWSVILDLNAPMTADRINEMVHANEVVAVRLPLPSGRTGTGSPAPAYIHGLSHSLPVPLIAADTSFRPAILRKCVDAGLQGVTIAEALDEAYTAGLRTALRDRSEQRPSRYLAKAENAVTSRFASYLSHLS